MWAGSRGSRDRRFNPASTDTVVMSTVDIGVLYTLSEFSLVRITPVMQNAPTSYLWKTDLELFLIGVSPLPWSHPSGRGLSEAWAYKAKL